MSKFKTGCKVKCVFVGDGTVGKTCMLQSYTSGQFPKDYVPTVFDNHMCPMVVDGLSINLELWDTAGQEGYKQIRPLAYTNTDVFVISFDVTNKTSFENVKKVWVPELRSYCKDVPLILVGTKIDLKKDKSSSTKFVDKKAGEALAHDISNGRYLECSALTQEGLKEVFETTVQVVMKGSNPNPGNTVGCFGKGFSLSFRKCSIL